MEFVKCSKDTFLNPLQVVSGIVERRHTLPVLANVLIRKEGQQVTLTTIGTNHRQRQETIGYLKIFTRW